MKNLRRAALLINSQSPHGNQLKGVSADSANMKAFLKSPLGGAYYDSEISILQNATCEKVMATLKELNVDYLLVHVSSHGFSFKNGQQMICLSDGNLADVSLFNQSLRQTILIDACATIPKSGARIGAIDSYEEEADYFDSSWARETFDNCIARSPFGRIIIRGARFGEKAYEETGRIGGQFTLALLDSMNQWQATGQEGVLPIEKILPYAQGILQNKPMKQTIEITYCTQGFTVPFGLISPRFISKPEERQPQLVPQQYDYSGLVAASLLIFVVAAFLK